jgi:type IV secretory pathway VirB2 component (pilin)
MPRNLETADKIAKLTLASATLILYFLDFISGPFARALMVLSAVVVCIYFIRTVFAKGE